MAACLGVRRVKFMKKINKKTMGFTLVELMITVTIIAILASIVYPSYTSHIMKVRRTDAKSSLLSLANQMERYFTLNNTYLGAAGTTAVPANTGAPRVYPSQTPVSGSTKYYNLTIFDATASSYEIRAIPIASSSQAGDSCGTLSITNTGVRSPTSSDCW